MEANINNECGLCICSFSIGTDRIWVFEVPDENRGFISGWIFLFNCSAYYYSIAGGSEGLSSYIANTYAEYLAEHKEFDLLEESMPKGEGWVLNDDMSIAFDEEFSHAMKDAGFVMEESGRWRYRPRPSRKAAPKREKKSSSRGTAT